MSTLFIVVVAATVAVPALTEAASASQAWHLSVGQVMVAARYAVLTVLVGMIGALTVLIVAQSADAAGYSRNLPPGTAYNTQANPHYGFGPVVRVQPTDVISGDRMIGRDPDPFIRNQMLRTYR
jgi:hypothetical protein